MPIVGGTAEPRGFRRSQEVTTIAVWWIGLTTSKLRILVVGLDSNSTLLSLPRGLRPQASFIRMRPSDTVSKQQ